MNYLHRTHGVVIAATIHDAAEELGCDASELTRLEEVAEARYARQRGKRKHRMASSDNLTDYRSDG